MIAEYLEQRGERNVALRMMDMGLPKETIVKCTSFSEQELEEFRLEREQEREAAGNGADPS